VATVYSLICWGGKTGKAVTVAYATDLVALTRHGLRDATGVQFVSGTLPSVSGAPLALDTTYYAKYISVNAFELYYDSDLISKIDFTSNGASLVLRSAYYQGLVDKSRWTYASVEFIYDGIGAWGAAKATASLFDSEICEIGMAWTEILTETLSLSGPAAVKKITAINDADHRGVIGKGYAIEMANSNYVVAMFRLSGISVDGITVSCTSTGSAVLLQGPFSVLDRCIVTGVVGSSNYGLQILSAVCTVSNCLFMGFKMGYSANSYQLSNIVLANNIFTKNDVGVISQRATNIWETLWNNISVGNITTDWGVMPVANTAGGNAGIAPWVSGTYPSYTLATSDFTDYANDNFRPALSTSPQVDSAIAYYNVVSTDITKAERPSYNNGGAEAYDIGCYEFDNGFGPHPASHVLTLTNVVTGSRVHISDQAGTVVHYDDTAASSTVVITQTVYGDSRDNWRIRVRKASDSPAYQPYETLMTATAGSSSLYIAQIQDE